MKKIIGKSLIVIAITAEVFYFISQGIYFILFFITMLICMGLFLWLLWWLFQ